MANNNYAELKIDTVDWDILVLQIFSAFLIWTLSAIFILAHLVQNTRKISPEKIKLPKLNY